MSVQNFDFPHLNLENRALLDLLRERDRRIAIDPDSRFPFIFRPCIVRVLLVTDGGLDFSANNFGLRTFVESLLTAPGYNVRFQLTLGHIDNVSDAQVMMGDPRIARSIKQFKFDDPAHFSPQQYDQIWLFGISPIYSRGNDINGQPYPTDGLSRAELRAISDFMTAGGGLFATGDHGQLGVCLSSKIPRARSMRLWGNTSPNDADNEVSMGGPRRNDTNRWGDATSEFNDQSDDVPQPISPKLYSARYGWYKAIWPHPLLCGPRGVIRVMPDHPHEGQCVEPADATATFDFGSGSKPEYPVPSGQPRPLPEIISWSSVLSGTTSGGKAGTQPHGFGGICAYDGHRAGVGRVVTDATWHHFVNVNLVGDQGVTAGQPKRVGFLATPTGQAHLEEIKTYYRNIAIWISRASNIVCMNRRHIWWLVWDERVMEATLTNPALPLGKLGAAELIAVGQHARDALGKYASQCQSLRVILWLLELQDKGRLRGLLDVWSPVSERADGEMAGQFDWVALQPVLDLALGGAIVALREKFGETPAPMMRDGDDRVLDEAVARGVGVALKHGYEGIQASLGAAAKMMGAGPTPPGAKPARKGTRGRRGG